MTIDADLFKQGMRQLGASVCLIATRQPDGSRIGLTATAVCSLSAEPALVLCCVNLSSRSLTVIRQTGLFAINVLSARDETLAQHFSTATPEERFSMGDWKHLSTGAPVLSSALSSFDCRLDRIVEAGTHAILIGAVQDMEVTQGVGSPLLYFQGAYGTFMARSAAAA